KRFGVIVSLDGAGAVTLHLPASGNASAALDAQGATPLPQAYELDDAPSFERFVLVASDSPFEVDTVLQAARTLVSGADAATSPLALPEGLEQTSVVVRKTR
ncbi:MAG TPA: ActD-like protein, partial [Vulgatibacter sp.]